MGTAEEPASGADPLEGVRNAVQEAGSQLAAALRACERLPSDSPDVADIRKCLCRAALLHLRDAVALLDAKATPQETADYKRFVVDLVERVASAHREGGHAQDPVSDAERSAIESIRAALG